MTESGTVGAGDQINTVTSYMIDFNLLPDQFVERFKQMEVEQQEIKNQVKQFDSAVTGYLNQLTKQIPQLIAKIETIGNANSTSSSAVLIRSKSTFQPIETEGELEELIEKAKNNDFIEQTIMSLGQICGKDTMMEGLFYFNFFNLDYFASRQFWTTCTWT